MQKIYDTIYKIDSKNKVRVWYMEQNNDTYRTWDGTQDGKIKCSEWRVAIPTNIGKSNERDGVAQAAFEIESQYKNKLEKDYHTSLESVDCGSHIIQPMLADKYKNFQPGFAQPKLDGIRCIATKNGLFSRQGKPITSCNHIEKTLAPLFENNPDLILDGELYNHEYKDDFNEIVSMVRKMNPTKDQQEVISSKVQYHVYDMPSQEGNFFRRSAYINLHLKDIPYVHIVGTIQVDNEENYDYFHGLWLEQGYEGSMWRNNTPYENKRTKNLLKRKDFVDEEFEVVAIEEGQGNWAGVAKRVKCRLSDGRTFGAGIKGTREAAAKLIHEKHHIVTVKYFQLTPDGIPRFGIATKFHGDKREF